MWLQDAALYKDSFRRITTIASVICTFSYVVNVLILMRNFPAQYTFTIPYRHGILEYMTDSGSARTLASCNHGVGRV
jgi:hypothetical protein